MYHTEFQQLNNTNSVLASTFNDEYENMKNSIEIKTEDIIEKKEQFGKNTSIIESEFNNFAKQFLNEFSNDLKIRNDFNVNLNKLIQFSKNEFLNQSSNLKKELFENNENTKIILNDLISETIKNYSRLEELIDNKNMQIRESSQNIIQRIESISYDIKLMNAKKGILFLIFSNFYIFFITRTRD